MTHRIPDAARITKVNGGHGRRVGLGVVAVAVALGAPHNANAGPGLARAAAACAPITVRLNTYTPDGRTRKIRTRVAIKRRHVSCAKARRLITTYVRRATPRRCATHGSRCLLPLGGGWWCSTFSPPETESTGGEIMGCARSRRTDFAIVPLRPAKVTQREFYVGSAPGVGCEITRRTLLCENTLRDHNEKATLAPNGTLHGCRWTYGGTTNGCDVGNAGEGTPTYKAGKTVTLGPYRCDITATGVRCVATASGKGFEMTLDGVTAIGGATLVQTPPQLEEVQSGDRQVWCGLIADPPMLVCTTAGGEHFGVVDNKGNVTLCNDTDGCTTKFGRTAPIIDPGDTVYVAGYRCTAAADGFTCIEPATGHGVIVTGGGASAL
jgi:hypothetical protein